jgi:hypothetical protein
MAYRIQGHGVDFTASGNPSSAEDNAKLSSTMVELYHKRTPTSLGCSQLPLLRLGKPPNPRPPGTENC